MLQRTLAIAFSMVLASCSTRVPVLGSSKFDQIVLDFGNPGLHGDVPTIWLSASVCYCSVLGALQDETRYEFRISKTDYQKMKSEVEKLIREGRRKLRDPHFDELVIGIFATTNSGTAACVEKPEHASWPAFEKVQDRFLQLFANVRREKLPFYKEKWNYPTRWSPPGFLKTEKMDELRHSDYKSGSQ